MKEIRITEDFYLYQFSPEAERVLGQNIFVLYSDDECIVFDAGYERHMHQLKEVIKDFKIKYVICTHFHPDHCYGLNELKKQVVIGSDEAINTLIMFDDQDNDLLIPSITVSDKKEIIFNGHRISLVKNHGHSLCGMLIEIDNQYLLTGDEFMTTNEGLAVLPYVADKINTHISGIENVIKNYPNDVFLPSHGKITNDITELEYRVRYLEFCKSKNINFDDFYLKDDQHFLNEKWHSSNISK
jgi:glyoxylase-like metal-dependent hydrolase (beta-lactamase superfamily II)